MINIEITNNILRRYKRTEAKCRYLNERSDLLSPSIDKSLFLFIRGVRKKVLNKKLIDIPNATTVP